MTHAEPNPPDPPTWKEKAWDCLADLADARERITALEAALREIKAAHINDGEFFPPSDLPRYEMRLVRAIDAGVALLPVVSPVQENPQK